MTIHPFVQSLVGGLLIGGSAAGLLLTNGRVAGISGIVAGAVSRRPQAWQWAFLLGLIVTGVVACGLGRLNATGLTGEPLGLLAVAGLLVGFGTRLGGGCTSGHGVCGLANLSPRSLVATLIFMGVAAAVVYGVRHIPAVGMLLAQAGWR